MPSLNDSLLIVTDLDGSLLDHHTYSWQPAQPWLDKLIQHQLPIVICSSKTASEIIVLQQQLNLSGMPFISENGALAQIDLSDFPQPLRRYGGADYASICYTLAHLRQQHGYKFTGFADVTANEVAQWTGLAPGDAANARLRQASESLIWRDSQSNFQQFCQHLTLAGLMITQGGRFWSVMGQESGKGTALRWLLANYPTHREGQRITLGLGDGPNDTGMLEVVDYAIVIKGHSKKPVQLNRNDDQQVYHTAAQGPLGWSEGLDFFLSE
ncbi:mannosyl-3-phosphoglycerate phosphatase [Izhakiella australiensis]|uniref:Mannosyl-3-phosphoglycerate phosphatase n=1 Tax=Izhakiella australiensis TaxID=1926881 RepID=A0A1S8Y8Y7_9GAMM|nr:mannosyl-3-phosphoglycerate phosphatase-related protein [Izhakiella australiensis]OON35581.1 mannosyl-3-phosphoglycerate phosphatase [Izhakiella australiensis]